MRRAPLASLLAAFLSLGAAAAQAAVGLMEVPGAEGDGTLTLLYPTDAPARALQRGGLVLALAPDAAPRRGNGRLVAMSHGSGGSPWTYFDLARYLVEHGFTVALPQHAKDNAQDGSEPGPPAWERRPQEISRAIDRVAADARLAPLLDLSRVGVYGMSAGGHTALTLAGGRWSAARLGRHCRAHAEEDFQACAGLATSLTGGPLDGLKTALVRWVDGWKFDDEREHGHTDPRIAAAVAGVPFAADFDPRSLQSPAVPLALVSARRDRWLVPRFHSDAVLQACGPCERLADLAEGGHGALLSPLPPGRGGLLAQLLDDPPGFDRAAATPMLADKILGFFERHLLDS